MCDREFTIPEFWSYGGRNCTDGQMHWLMWRHVSIYYLALSRNAIDVYYRHASVNGYTKVFESFLFMISMCPSSIFSAGSTVNKVRVKPCWKDFTLYRILLVDIISDCSMWIYCVLSGKITLLGFHSSLLPFLGRVKSLRGKTLSYEKILLLSVEIFLELFRCPIKQTGRHKVCLSLKKGWTLSLYVHLSKVAIKPAYLGFLKPT